MCGIAGVFHHQTERAIEPQTLVNMAAIMHHRGPDGFGYEVQQDYGVGFSHARLSIIDLDEKRGRQPFLSADKRLMLTHNGEFYDFKRIRADLTARGARFNSKSDSEIVLHLFERYGLEDTLKELRGEFAFGLFDAEDESLYLVRDRFGIKPLYWTETEHGVVFGSELKVLFSHPDVKREFSAEGLYHQLIQVMVPGSTAFEGINQVQPGYVVKLQRKNGKVVATEHKYWDVDFPPEESYPGADVDEESYIEGVRAKLLEAVQHRMTADVPVGCYLSGGIDSCAILGLASASTQTSVKAFTIGFDSDDYDETPIAQEMAEATQADHHIMRLKADDLYDHFVKTLWHTERTIYNTLGVAKYLMSKEVHESGYKVVMTGEGSDELFAGYPAFRKDMFLHGLDHLPEVERVEWQELLEKNNKLFKGAMLAREEFVSDAFNQKMGFTPSCVQPWLSCSSVALPLMSESKRQQVEGYDPSTAIADTLDKNMLDGRHPLDRAQYVWIKTMLEGQILTWGGDRVDMANSMEARPAFLDHHLAEYAFTVPPHLRIKGNKEKYVLREAMKGLLPETLYKREKFAFMAPPAHTDPEKWKAVEKLAEQFLSEDAVKSAGLLDYSEVVKTFERHQDENVPNEERVQLDAVINHMLGVQVLHHHFVATDVPKQAEQRARELGWTA
ncbi:MULTISPECIES: asparagine synthase (glutamine-hydrolyzing) [Idiomarina]|jgi:asparagine synthase (glutamine-hydrolysing)|uniref:asparagine synthase (glutamine-hydrolyzing) n=1 Tax=Idiomarina TaxID=135575 RepID=UPI0006C8430E|nr:MULTISPECIES: asparagine synthase (glutamine-hydrolyzing) [Idiomarina]KPD22414.1 asparagine synthase [Idiomarina abyssalis]MBE92262.1 asparagine synthetase B [Idiomarina sp.]MBP59202.1 asparagine synthetase B [Idiomarina sp.]MDA6066260.1 asparagine synthase (glutamine-hydrolyzing) [Idiomarina abyssalis]SFT40351.1 asparagine synthase (glutamine-hydrolysing) [Idiomarina abyssalis]|tara:strand:+ start:81 stop:2096 length:2016 start_codon:yes stop_codon:yes gene_type:complete